MSIQMEATVPVAGWYEDPLSSSAMRWWNGFGWTEHTQAPQAVAKVIAVKDLPVLGGAGAIAAARTQPDVPNVHDIRSHPGRAADEGRAGRAPIVPAWLRPTRWSTPGVWAMSFTPWSTVLIAFTTAALVALGAAWFVVLGAVVLPLLLWIAFAVRDRRRLAVLGYGKRASWAWVLLSPAAYLIARGIRVHRASGHGWAPFWVLLVNIVVVAGAVFGMALVIEAPSAPRQVESVVTTITQNIDLWLR